jgi:hypothetical protein
MDGVAMSQKTTFFIVTAVKHQISQKSVCLLAELSTPDLLNMKHGWLHSATMADSAPNG